MYNGGKFFGGDMRRLLVLACVPLALLALAACNKPNKFAPMRDMGAVVEFPSFPAPPKGVAGYNLYMAGKAAGPWEKMNDAPINGGRLMIPHLEEGKEYLFRMTSVGFNGAESKPGGVLKKKAVLKP